MGSVPPYETKYHHKAFDTDADERPIVNNISVNRVAQIEKILGVDLTCNFLGKNNLNSHRNYTACEELLQLIKYFDRITDPAVRANLLTLVQAAADAECAKGEISDPCTR